MATEFEGEDLLGEYRPLGGDQLIVTFSNFAKRPPSRPFATSFLASRGISYLAIRARRNEWYHTREFEMLRRKIGYENHGYNRVITYGSSMGGHAALRLAGFFGAERAIAVAPQYSIDRSVMPTETRWPAEAEKVALLSRDDPHSISEGIEKLVIFDPLDTLDAAQAKRALQVPGTVAIKAPLAGHGALQQLKTAGLLSTFLEGLLAPQVDLGAARRLVRQSTKVPTSNYFYNLVWRRWKDTDPAKALALAAQREKANGLPDWKSLYLMAMLAKRAGRPPLARQYCARSLEDIANVKTLSLALNLLQMRESELAEDVLNARVPKVRHKAIENLCRHLVEA
ncbi:hypothetical protein DRW48_12960 [Paracoccus suum]|uniref:Alpha/beta hydrolase n=1 Tax=Paracoccus suum TaxID=2259340 RepID=A0A344PM61_9RHOB|nr:hypothetical protein [Paracoccus suum]AXC50466.1 hypothetical protein DRW48_12960 [Paracoccus suum]